MHFLKHTHTHPPTYTHKPLTPVGHWTLLIGQWQLLKPIWGRKYFFDLLTFRKTYYSQNKVYFFPLYCFLVWICWTKNQGLLPFSYDTWLSQECFKNLILVKTQFLKESFFFLSLSIIHNAREHNKWDNVGDTAAIH